MAGATNSVRPEAWRWVRAMWEVRGGRCLSLSLLLVSVLCVSLLLFSEPLPAPLHPLPVGQPPQSAPPGHPRRGEQNIMFVETSCALKEVPWSGLSPRQSCAVESAVRHNPSWSVYVLHTCAGPARQVPRGARAVHVPLRAFLSDTPLLAPLLEAGALADSKWPVEHASDVMRFTALWKYGGIYLDTDVVVLRPLSDLGWDWAGAESSELVASCALSMSTSAKSAGQQVAEACMQSLRDDFKGDQWTHNGPQLITRVLMDRCSAKNTTAMSYCRGFRVLPTALLFPLDFDSWRRFFSPSDSNQTLLSTRHAYTVHLWNKLSREELVVHPKSAYAIIAKENCPHTYSMANGKL